MTPMRMSMLDVMAHVLSTLSLEVITGFVHQQQFRRPWLVDHSLVAAFSIENPAALLAPASSFRAASAFYRHGLLIVRGRGGMVGFSGVASTVGSADPWGFIVNHVQIIKMPPR